MLIAGRITVSTLWLCIEAVPLIVAQTWWMAKRSHPWSPRTVKWAVCLLLVVIGVGLVAPVVRTWLIAVPAHAKVHAYEFT